MDAQRIAAIDPDVILSQDLCRVCAVPTGDVEAALGVLGCRAEVVSLDPATLDDVIACIGRVGDATGDQCARRRAHGAAHGEGRRGPRRRCRLARPRTFALEWSDPPFSAGHWVADMIDAAGGDPVLTARGERSRRLGWDEIAREQPDLVVFMPCGYGLDAAVAEGRSRP